MMKEMQGSGDFATATLSTKGMVTDAIGLEGSYHVVCRNKEGNLKWEEKFDNQVVQAGKILAMNTLLYTASGYTLVGPYLGLVSGSSSTFSPTDTMASHAGWTEFSAYTVSSAANRGTATFSTATGNASTVSGSNIVYSNASSITYTITGSGGVIGGCFLVTGSGAVNTFGSTTGTLWSAGAFSTAKTTTVGDTVVVSYTTTATS